MLPHVPLYRTTQKPPITCESKEHPTNMFPPLVMPHVSGLCQPPSWRRGNVSNIVAQVRGEARYRTREKLGGKRKTQRSSAGRPKFPVPGSTIPPGWEMTTQTGKSSLAGWGENRWRTPAGPPPGRWKSLCLSLEDYLAHPDETQSSGMSAETQPSCFGLLPSWGIRVER